MITVRRISNGFVVSEPSDTLDMTIETAHVADQVSDAEAFTKLCYHLQESLGLLEGKRAMRRAYHVVIPGNDYEDGIDEQYAVYLSTDLDNILAALTRNKTKVPEGWYNQKAVQAALDAYGAEIEREYKEATGD